MSEIEELSAFVLKQLSTAATEIIGAFTKTITSYEERISCLEKENERFRSLSTAELPKTKDDHVTKHCAVNTSDNPSADALEPHAIDSEIDCKTKETELFSSTDVGSIVMRDQFLKSVSTENCPFCYRKVAATAKHLTQKHYDVAVRFIKDGTVKFVVPCMCKVACQRRSHYHCPICIRTITRRCYFEVHLTRIHACSILRLGNNADAEAAKAAESIAPHAIDSEIDFKTKETELSPSTEVRSFVTRDHFLKSVSTKNCPYCFQKVMATTKHLTDKHYNAAVRFIEDGTVKFVVPCMCKEAPRQRSHWHCPLCVRTINRRSTFEVHITRQHACSILQPSYGAGKVLQIYHEKEERRRRLETRLARQLDICVVDSYIQDLEEIGTKSNSQQDASTQVIKTLDGGFAELLDPADESQHTTKNKNITKTEELETTQDSSEAVSPLRIKPVKRPSFPGNPSGKRAAHRCKACGKIFHYMYTLKTHVHTHARDRVSVCGLCGKRLGYKEHLVQHLKNHNRKNKCETCGKQFSSDSRLKRHKIFHQPKTMNPFS